MQRSGAALITCCTRRILMRRELKWLVELVDNKSQKSNTVSKTVIMSCTVGRMDRIEIDKERHNRVPLVMSSTVIRVDRSENEIEQLILFPINVAKPFFEVM